MTTVNPLETETVSAYYDTRQQIAFISYRNQLEPNAIKLVYEWIGTSATSIGIENVRGGVFDFRLVTDFGPYNFTVLRQERQKVKSQHNFSHIPTALIVRNALQEQMVYTAQKITEHSDRFKVVKDMVSALDFINAWHQQGQ